MVTRQLSDNQYPDFLLNGGPIAYVLKALSKRLKIAFQEKFFTHHIIAPNAGKKMWDAVLKTSPLVAVSFASWKRSSRLSSGFFRGDMTFPVFIALQHNTPEALMLGSGQLRGMGVAGVMSMAAAMLDGWTLDGVGTAEMQVAELPPTADWLEERMALVALNIVFPDVGFDAGSDAAMLDGLNDFLQLAEKSQVNGQAEPDAVLNVRDQK